MEAFTPFFTLLAFNGPYNPSSKPCPTTCGKNDYGSQQAVGAVAFDPAEYLRVPISGERVKPSHSVS